MNASQSTPENTKPTRQPLETQVGLDSAGGFELTMRIANMLANSTMVPESFRVAIPNKKAAKLADGSYPLIENPSGLSNCVIALNMANRMGADPLMIMQNLYPIEGRISWSSQFVIASINSCGRYSPLRFDIVDKGEIEVEYTARKWNKAKGGYDESLHKVKVNNLVCIAWAIEKETGERLESSPVSMELAVKEGWYQKSGSKWQTMPEQMLRYRSASFFGSIYAPELKMGLRTADEEHDMIDVTPTNSSTPANAKHTSTIDRLNDLIRSGSIDSTVEDLSIGKPSFADIAEEISRAPMRDQVTDEETMCIRDMILNHDDDDEREKLLALYAEKFNA